MRFQPVKCNIMQLTRKRIKMINAVYSLEGTVLENVDNIYTTQSLLRITFLTSDILFILSPYIIKLLLNVNRCSGLINV